jgi:hypothetical protein
MLNAEFCRCEHPAGRCTLLDKTENIETSFLADPKIDAVRRLYAAYGRGDVDAVPAELADDIDCGGGRQHVHAVVRQLTRQAGRSVQFADVQAPSCRIGLPTNRFRASRC